MNKVTNKLQSLIFGDRSTFIINRNNNINETQTSVEQVAKVLHKLESKGYAPINADILLKLNDNELKAFKKDFTSLVKNSTKTGRVIRTSFFDEAYPTDYTSEEWDAIIAQYALTYGWANEYNIITQNSAENVLQEYVDKFSDKKINLTKNAEIKQFTLGTTNTLFNIINKILSSKVVLRTQQIEVLKECPKDILVDAVKNTHIPIKETLVLTMSLLRSVNVDFPVLKTAQDVLRYIVTVFAETPVEGQLNKTILKDCKIHIPTSDRKTILNNLELIANNHKQKSKFLCEDMYSYEAYWKLIHKYLQFEKYSKTRKKYPLYTSAIDLLYENDRSWTFNGRFSKAKEDLDYAAAATIAAERPGFLLRNMLELMRMVVGVKIPKKKTDKSSISAAKRANNPFANKLKSKKKTTPTKSIKIISDAKTFFESAEFSDICNTKLNTKLAFQLIEQIEEPRNNKSQYKRMVQDTLIEYSVPIPAINKDMKEIVLNQLNKSIKSKLRESNKNINLVFIDEDVSTYALQYSGHTSTELSLSGEYLSKNSIIPLDTLLKDDAIIRLGVMWRSRPNSPMSVDIDHSVTMIDKTGDTHQIYYSQPTFKTRNGSIAAASSGDITSCGSSTSEFSTEIVDLDVNKLKRAGITDIFNSFINFHGSTPIGALECYTFMQILTAKTVATAGSRNKIKIDLGKTDYAIQIDANNVDNTGSYIGMHFDLSENDVEVLAIPVKNSGGGYSNVKTKAQDFFKAIENRTQSYELGEALKLAFSKEQRTTVLNSAQLVISRKNRDVLNLSDETVLIHPGKNPELINTLIFQ